MRGRFLVAVFGRKGSSPVFNAAHPLDLDCDSAIRLMDKFQIVGVLGVVERKVISIPVSVRIFWLRAVRTANFLGTETNTRSSVALT